MNIVTRITSIVFCTAMAFGSASGQRLTGFAGAFAPIGVSARTTALGGTRVVAAIGPDALFGNPAALPSHATPVVAFHYFRLFGLVPYLAAAGDFRIPGHTWLGLAVSSNGDALYRENAILLAYCRQTMWQGKALDVGATLTLRYASFGKGSTVAGSVTGSAIGAGLSAGLRFWLTDSFAVGLLFQDMPNVLRWSTSAGKPAYSEGIPVHLILGAGAFDVAGMTLACDWDKSLYSETSDRLRLGVERRIMPSLVVQGGYAAALAAPEYTQYTVGIGTEFHTGSDQLARLQLSYVLQELPNTLRVSVSFAF